MSWSYGTNADRAAVLDRLAASGAGWVRLDLPWGLLEPQRGSYDYWGVRHADNVVDMARARGLKVLAVLWGSPGWANGGQTYTVAPTNAADYASIAGWAADHFRGRVSAWEVWNEPNSDTFWKGTISQYAGLLRAAYPRFHAADPTAPVVLGGPDYVDTTWVSALYDLGVANSFDVLGVHPYQGMMDLAPEAPDNGTIWRMSHLPAMRELMVSRGDGAKAMWITEFGYSSHLTAVGAPNWQRGVTEAQQADYLARSLTYVRDNFPYVTHFFWYADRNGDSGDLHYDNFGLLRADATPKPAYLALQAWMTAQRVTATTTVDTTSTTSTATTSTTTTARGGKRNRQVVPGSSSLRTRIGAGVRWTHHRSTGTTARGLLPTHTSRPLQIGA